MPQLLNVTKYLGARAYDNTVYVAACNHVTPEGGGGLGVWACRSAASLRQYQGSDERALYCDLDLRALSLLRQADSKIFYLKDRRSRLYGTAAGQPQDR